jgi:hypothetical protein
VAKYELGRLFAAISLGLRRALRLGLCIADGLGQHLAQLSLGSRRFARESFCPCGHGQYMGMQDGELNPWALSGVRISMSASDPSTDLLRTSRHVRKVPIVDITIGTSYRDNG